MTAFAIPTYEADALPLVAILEFMRIYRATFYQTYANWLETGAVVREEDLILHFSDIDYLKRLIQHQPDCFLDKLLYLLQTNHFMSLHYTTIHWELVCAGVSSKKIKKIASERNEAIWTDFVCRMAQYTPEQLGFLDEVSKDERTPFKIMGALSRAFKLFRRVFLSMDNTFQLKVYSVSTVSSCVLWLKVLRLRSLNILSKVL